MANLLKSAKRGRALPRITNGRISTGTNINWVRTDDSGMCSASETFHTLDVFTGFGPDRVEYQLQLTEAEVIAVTSDWLTTMNRRRIADEADAADKIRRKAAKPVFGIGGGRINRCP